MSDQFANFTKDTKAPGDLYGASEDVPRMFTDQALTGALAAAAAVAGHPHWMFGTEAPTTAQERLYKKHATEWAQFNRDNPAGPLQAQQHMIARASWLKAVHLGFYAAEMPEVEQRDEAYAEVPVLTRLAFEVFNTVLNRASDGMAVAVLEAATLERNARLRAEHEAEVATREAAEAAETAEDEKA